MSPTLAGLHALARQAGARPRIHALSPHTTSPIADVQRLREVLRLRAPRVVAHTVAAVERVLPGEELAPGVRLVQARLPAVSPPAALDGAFDRRTSFDPRRVLFFDTETTGLAGGTGTRAFMLGAAHWEGSALVVRQLIITTLAAERAMLAEFARWIQPDTVLASYNGKSYDAPLLRTRYRLVGLADPTAGLAHVDLLYSTRRRYRGAFENCRLATIERKVLKIVREDDLPGSEAPAAWLTYLRGGSACNLRRVLAHNHQDVVTLARLLLHLAGEPDG